MTLILLVDFCDLRKSQHTEFLDAGSKQLGYRLTLSPTLGALALLPGTVVRFVKKWYFVVLWRRTAHLWHQMRLAHRPGNSA